MKKSIFLSLSLFAITLWANSPLDAGVISIAGQLNATSYSENYQSESNGTVFEGERKFKLVNISPQFSYFITQNISIGISMSLGGTYTEHNPSSEDSHSTLETRYGIGPSLRYYPLKSALNPYLGLRYSWQLNDGDHDYYTSNYTVNRLTFSLGSEYFITSHVAINSSLNYSKYNRETEIEYIEDRPTYSYLSRNSSFYLSVGISTYIY